MVENNITPQQAAADPVPPFPGPCPVPAAANQTPLTNLGTTFVPGAAVGAVKIPAVIAEPTLRIVVEANIPLASAATEIKRVKKNIFLDQVKLVPVAFARIDGTDYFVATRATVFVAGHIRKNIEYAGAGCAGPLLNQIADVPFSGYTDLTTFTTPPIIGIAETAEANFLNETTQMDARLDKFFFNNLVKYNEQPFGELVAANMFELDFSPTLTSPEGAFTTLTEKIVLNLTVKVLQVQQMTATGLVQRIPLFPFPTTP
ncbi:MAG: Uracil permease [Bacillota bacterium]|nr:Uracil permease [Bacillota bacterium]